MSNEVGVSFYFFFPQKATSKTGEEELKALSTEEEKQSSARQYHCILINLTTIIQKDADAHIATSEPSTETSCLLCHSRIHSAHNLKNIILKTRQPDSLQS